MRRGIFDVGIATNASARTMCLRTEIKSLSSDGGDAEGEQKCKLHKLNKEKLVWLTSQTKDFSAIDTHSA